MHEAYEEPTMLVSMTHVDHGISLRSTACVLGTGAVLMFYVMLHR